MVMVRRMGAVNRGNGRLALKRMHTRQHVLQRRGRRIVPVNNAVRQRLEVLAQLRIVRGRLQPDPLERV